MALCDLLQQLEGLSPTELDAVAAIAAAKARDLQSCIVASRKLRGAPPDIASIQARADATKGPAVAFLATRSSERRQAQDAEAAARSTVTGAEGLEWAALEEAAYRVQRTAVYATNVALLWHHGLALRSLSDEEGHRAALREAEAAQRADIFTSVVATVAAATATEAVALFQERETVDRVALEEAWAGEQAAVATAEQRSFWACRLTSVQDEEVAQRIATERAMGTAVETLRRDDEAGQAAVGALEALRCLVAAEGTAREECRSTETSASDSLHTEWCLTRSHLADVEAQASLAGDERAARASITSAFGLDCSNLCSSAEDLTRRGVFDDESSGRVALVAAAKQLQLMANEERDRCRCLQEWEAPLGPWRAVACSVEEEDHHREALSEAEGREWTLVARCGHSLADTNRDAVEAQVALALEEGNLRDSLDVAEDRDRADVAAAEQQVRVDVAETVARADLLRSEGVAVESVISQCRAERAARVSMLHVAEREDLCAGEAAARAAIIEAGANDGGEVLGNAGRHRVLVRCAEAEGVARADLLSTAEATLADIIAAARAGAHDIEGCAAMEHEASTARDELHQEEAVAAGVLFHDALDAEECCHVVDDAVAGALRVERSERDGRADIVAFMAEEKRQIQVSIDADRKAAEEARIEAERIEAERKAAEEKAAEEARIEAERKAAEEKAAEEARIKAEEKDKVPLSDLIRRVPTQMVPAFKMRRNALFKLFDPAATNAVAQADAERCVAEVLQLTIPAPVIQAAFTQSCAAAHGEDSPMTRGSFRLFLLCLRRYLEVADVCPGPADPDAFRAIAAAMATWPVPVPSPDAAFAKISAGAPRAPLLVVCRWAMAEQLAVDTALDDDSASPQRRATPSQEPSRPAFDEPPFTKGGMLQNFGKKAFFRSFKPFFVVCEPDRIAWFKSEADCDRKAAPVDSVPLFTVTTNSRGSHFKTPAVCQPVLVDGDCSKATDAKTAYFAVDWVLPNGDTEKLVLGAPSVRERQDWVRFITRYIPRCIPPGCVDAEAISRMPVGSDPPKHRREATGGEAPGTRQK